MNIDSSLIRRHMKRSPNFVVCNDESRAPFPLLLEPEESLVGRLQSPPPWQDPHVVFTSKAIHTTENGHVTRIGLDRIVGYETPKEKANLPGISIRTPDGSQFIRAAGRYGPGEKYSDAFNLIMILRVLVDRKGTGDRPFTLTVEPETVRPGRPGPATGSIWVVLGKEPFPLVGWNDFVVVIMEALSSAVQRIVAGTSQSEVVHFMEGPRSPRRRWRSSRHCSPPLALTLTSRGRHGEAAERAGVPAREKA